MMASCSIETSPTSDGAKACSGARPTRARRLLVALAISVLVHAVLLLAPLREISSEPETSEISIVSLDVAEEQHVDEPEPAHEPLHEPTETAAVEDDLPSRASPHEKMEEPRPEHKAPRPSSVAREERARPPVEPAPAPAPDDAADPGSDAGEDPKRLAELERDPSGLDLFPPEILGDISREQSPTRPGLDEDEGETIRAPPRASSDERAEMAEQRIAAYVRDEKARHRVRTGLVDPYFIRLKESFGNEFEPVWAHLDEGSGEGLMSDLAAWLRDHQRSMERYAETGSPYHEGGSSAIGPYDPLAHPVAPTGTIAFEDSRHDLQRRRMKHALFLDISRGRAGGMDLVAVLRVTQSPNGVIMKVEIEQSSGRREYDDLARETISRTLSRAEEPERAGRGLGLTGERIETLWAFRTRFVVVPPVPMSACEFDLDGIGDCIRPLERRVLPRVELEAVY